MKTTSKLNTMNRNRTKYYHFTGEKKKGGGGKGRGTISELQKLKHAKSDLSTYILFISLD